MASSWGNSWGYSWGNSWGIIAAVVPVPQPQQSGGVSGRGVPIEYGDYSTRKKKRVVPVEAKEIHPAIKNGKTLSEYQDSILKQEALERRKLLAAQRLLDEEDIEALLLCPTL